MLVNIWKSTITGCEVEAPVDFLPDFGGWELIATVEKES